MWTEFNNLKKNFKWGVIYANPICNNLATVISNSKMVDGKVKILIRDWLWTQLVHCASCICNILPSQQYGCLPSGPVYFSITQSSHRAWWHARLSLSLFPWLEDDQYALVQWQRGLQGSLVPKHPYQPAWLPGTAPSPGRDSSLWSWTLINSGLVWEQQDHLRRCSSQHLQVRQVYIWIYRSLYSDHSDGHPWVSQIHSYTHLIVWYWSFALWNSCTTWQ